MTDEEIAAKERLAEAWEATSYSRHITFIGDGQSGERMAAAAMVFELRRTLAALREAKEALRTQMQNSNPDRCGGCEANLFMGQPHAPDCPVGKVLNG